MEHYFTENPKSIMIPHRFTAILLGKELTFHTGSGVFSLKKIDKGTQVLIENCIVKNNWKVLDLCCGYGPVGIALAKKYNISLVMTDINHRAMMLAKKNIIENSLKDIKLRDGHLFEKFKDIDFDTILVNPPQTAGKSICIEIIVDSKKHLKPGGTLQLVARHNKGGRFLSEIMKKTFSNVKDIAKKSGYRVYVSKKS